MNRVGKIRIGIAGTGRVAQALGRLLHQRGHLITAIAGRDLRRTSEAAAFIGMNVRSVSLPDLPRAASHVIVAVPDDALPLVARTLAGSEAPIRVALHTCGSRGPEALAGLAERGASYGALRSYGASLGTLHPLQTISTREQGAADLPGSYFGITASGEALEWALEICGALDGHPLVIAPERRPLYHAAAVMASNYIVAMIDAAAMLMERAGVAADQALPALAPLIEASVRNSLNSGPVQALTGPIERGDEQTIASHVRALGDAPESVRNLYRSAGLHAANIARRKSPGADRSKIESLLTEESPEDEG